MPLVEKVPDGGRYPDRSRDRVLAASGLGTVLPVPPSLGHFPSVSACVQSSRFPFFDELSFAEILPLSLPISL